MLHSVYPYLALFNFRFENFHSLGNMLFYGTDTDA